VVPAPLEGAFFKPDVHPVTGVHLGAKHIIIILGDFGQFWAIFW
jgi:hypothetical protein